MIENAAHTEIVLDIEAEICDNRRKESGSFSDNNIHLFQIRLVWHIVQQKCRGKPPWYPSYEYGSCIEIWEKRKSKNLTMSPRSQKLLLVNSILDVVFLLVMLLVFFKKADRKAIFLITVVIAALIGYFTIFPKSQSLTAESSIICELNGITEEYYIKMRDDGVILEIRGNEAIYEEIDIDSLDSVPEVIHALQDYYESNGGTWKFE